MCSGQWGYFWDCTSVPNGFAWMVWLLTSSQENPCTWLCLICFDMIMVTSEGNPGQLPFCWCAGCSSVVSVTNRTEKIQRKMHIYSITRTLYSILWCTCTFLRILVVCYLFYGSCSFYSFWNQVLRMALVLFCKELWVCPVLIKVVRYCFNPVLPSSLDFQ